MGPHSHSPEEHSAPDSPESWIDRLRKRQEERHRRQRQAEEVTETTEPTKTEAAESTEEAPPKKRARRLGRALIRALRPAQTEENLHHSPEQLDKEVAHSRRVRLVTRQVFALLNRRREDVIQAVQYEPASEVVREVAPLNQAEEHLAEADTAVAEELAQAEAYSSASPARPRIESAMDAPTEIPDYDPVKVAQLQAPAAAESARRASEYAAAHTATTAEYALRRANQAAGGAVVAGAGAAWALHRAHQAREQVHEVKNQQKSLDAERQSFDRRLQNNEQAVLQLRHRPEQLHNPARRQEAVQAVAQVAERQAVVANQAAERLRIERGAVSRQPEQQAAEGVAPVEAAPSSTLSPDKKISLAPKLESLLGLSSTVEIAKPPSERELSDRVERQPGLANTAHDSSQDNGALQQQNAPASSTVTIGASQTHASPQSRQAQAKHAPGAPHSTTFALVVITILLALGILFLLNHL